MKQWFLKRKMKKAQPLYIVYENEQGWEVLYACSVGKTDEEGRPLIYRQTDMGTIIIDSWKLASRYPTAAYFYNPQEACDLAYYLQTGSARV